MSPGYASEVMLGYKHRCAICKRLIERRDACAAVSKKDLRRRKSYWKGLCKQYKIHPVVID